MNIKQFSYNADNFGYMIFGQKECIVIDGGAVEDIIDFAKQNSIKIKFTVNTHGHQDHTQGTKELTDKVNAIYIDNKTLLKQKRVEIEGNNIQVFHTPGHTADSIVFYFDNILVTGDTLFNGTIGTCFSGDIKAFYKSIKMLMEFDYDTKVFAGHDYVKESLGFAKLIEPDNLYIDKYLKLYDPKYVSSTIKDELEMNPYLRFNQKSIIAVLKNKGLAVQTEYDRWQGIMSI